MKLMYEGNKNIKTGVYIVVLLVCVVLVWNVSTFFQHRGKLRIAVQAIPADSTLSLDGKSVRAGNIYMTPGVHVLQASRQYFDTATTKINTSNVAPSEVIYLLPTPSSNEAKKWLTENPKVQAQREAQGGAESETVQNKVAESPFLKQLPILYGDGHGGFVRMSTGAPLRAGSPPSVHVSALTPELRQGVLEYMRTRGYDPANMDIVFVYQLNPLDKNP